MKKTKIFNVLLCISIIFYIILVLWVIPFKFVAPWQLFSPDRYFRRSYNLIPFKGMLYGYFSGLDFYGNIIIFIPMGIYFSMFFSKAKAYSNVLKIALISITFELMQYAFSIGSSDVTDIITNTIGGIIGVIIYYCIRKISKTDALAKKVISVAGFIIIIPVTLIIIIIALLILF